MSTHRMSTSREYTSWIAMKVRCYRPSHKSYAEYGGRGITVCPEWLHDFTAFLIDMGPRPAGHSLDRIDGAGPYEPANCRWATPAEQVRNRRDYRPYQPSGSPRKPYKSKDDRPVEYGGLDWTITSLAAHLGLKADVVRLRLLRGAPLDTKPYYRA